ncbi:head decoration protein [Desulfovibrio sp. OttesenSCG-928-G11]|nr:head decoration protein [Desulfovibrio sp. OttesenSCG-928-G11]
MEKIAGYTDEKLLREHPVIMQRMIITNTGTAVLELERGSVLGAGEGGIKVFFATGLTEALGILAEPVTVPAKSGSVNGEAHVAVYVHGDFVADQLKFAASATDADKAVALTSLKLMGCYAS